MAPTDNSTTRSSPQGRQEDNGSRNPPDNGMSGRIESFADVSAFEYFHYDDNYVSPLHSPALKGRESLVSMMEPPLSSLQESSRSGASRWNGTSLISHRGSFNPAADSKRKSRAARMSSGWHSGPGDVATVMEVDQERENFDIALLSAAAPISGSATAQDNSSNSTSPPERPQNSPLLMKPGMIAKVVDEQATKWQEQEQAGQLTGGLGAGFQPATTIKEEELLSPTSPAMKRRMTFSLRGLSRSATVKVLGQSEADRTGQPIQVILEELEASDRMDATRSPLMHRDSRIDLSFVAGDEAPVGMEELRPMSKSSTTLSSQKLQRVETFYPQPDWKPFSMRWPYLVSMILFSILLSTFTELLYQHSSKNDLVTFKTPSEIAGITYFCIKFLPTIVAVLYGVLWQMTEFEVKRLEPFYQLSKDHGATAAESLNVDYITSVIFLRPLRSLQRRHFAVTISTVASLLAVSAVPTLSSAMIVLWPNREERLANPTELKHISVHPVWSRLLEAVLIINAILGAALLWQLSRRRSGLFADVKGIAGLAAMANVSHILMDFKDMDVATHKDIHQRLAKRRYQLKNSALVPMGREESDVDVSKVVLGIPTMPVQELSANFYGSINPHPLMFRKRGALPFIVGVFLFIVLLPAFLFTPVGNFLDVAPWTITLIAVGIKLAWGALDTTTRLMEPFYMLYRRHAPPKTLTLDYTAMPFAWVAVKALLNRHYLVSAVCFGTVMAEVLTVLVASLATVEGGAFTPSSPHAMNMNPTSEDINAGEETVHSFWISLSTATFILAYLLIVSSVVFLRRRQPFLPRQPNTIASVLGYIHQSKMLYDFVGTEKKSNDEMAAWLEKVGRTYGLGWFEGRDGRVHCGVDQEEMSASYRHGVDFQGSNRPWVEDIAGWTY